MHVYTSAWNSKRNRRPRTRGRLHLLAMAQPPLLQPRRLPTFLCGYGCTAFSVVPPAGGRCFGRNLQIAAPDPDPLPPANQVGYRVGNTQRESVTTEAKGERTEREQTLTNRQSIRDPAPSPHPQARGAAARRARCGVRPHQGRPAAETDPHQGWTAAIPRRPRRPATRAGRGEPGSLPHYRASRRSPSRSPAAESRRSENPAEFAGWCHGPGLEIAME